MVTIIGKQRPTSRTHMQSHLLVPAAGDAPASGSTYPRGTPRNLDRRQR